MSLHEVKLIGMNRETQIEVETRVLGTLCRVAGAREQCAEIVSALDGYEFLEPEHQIVFGSIGVLLAGGRLSTANLAVHLNNRGFPDVDLDRYREAGLPSIDAALQLSRQLSSLKKSPGDDVRKKNSRMKSETPSERGLGKVGIMFSVLMVALVVLAAIGARPLRRYLRESLMQSVTSAHYRVLCPPGALSQAAMTQFATQREPLFTSLNAKLNDVASNAEIRVIFDPEFRMPAAGAEETFRVSGATVRTALPGRVPKLDPAADAEALLHIAWGQPGNPLVAHWTALWLVGNWEGQELGMAAAQVEQKIGHKKVANLLAQPPDASISVTDRGLLGAAWINAIAELGGTAEVRKLYSAKMKNLDVPEVTKALGTTPTELERKWQMWMYAYIAGMPPANHSMSMPMNMPMSK